MAKKPVLLCIMDGFGWVPGETYGNKRIPHTCCRFPTIKSSLYSIIIFFFRSRGISRRA